MRSIFRPLFVILGVIGIAGCSTPYQEMGLLGGVSATQIDATTMRISSRGNAFSDIGRMKDFVMLRAAEETIGHGYDLFQISDAENVSRTEHYSVSEFHSAPVVTTGFGPSGPVSTFGTVNYTTESEQAVNKPGEDIMIRMFRGAKPASAPANMFAASEIVTYLGPRIRPEDGSKLAASEVTEVASPAPASTVQLVPPVACTKQDHEIARLAKANGYQYRSNCP